MSYTRAAIFCREEIVYSLPQFSNLSQAVIFVKASGKQRLLWCTIYTGILPITLYLAMLTSYHKHKLEATKKWRSQFRICGDGSICLINFKAIGRGV